VPFLGSLPFIKSKNFHYELEKLRDRYGPVIGLKFGPLPAVAVCGPEEVIHVFKNEDFSGRPAIISQNRGGEQGIKKLSKRSVRFDKMSGVRMSVCQSALEVTVFKRFR